jgi:hypothetical protein
MTIASAIKTTSAAKFRALRSYSFPSSGTLLPTANYPIAFASPEIIDDERIPPWAQHDDMPGRRIDIVEVDAINVLAWIAQDAQRLASEAEKETTRAAELARASGRQSKAIVRDRVGVLVGELQGARWELADIADLIAASGTDWTKPPSSLSVTYRYDWRSEARRTEPKRVALTGWLRDQLRASKREKARQRSRKKRPDRRR